MSTLGPNVRHWSRGFSVWSKKAVSSPLRGPWAGLLWGSGLLGILINSLVGLMDYQAVSWQWGLGWGEQIAAHKSACCLPPLCFNGSHSACGPATERWLHFPHPADGSNRLAQSFTKSTEKEGRPGDWPSGPGTMWGRRMNVNALHAVPALFPLLTAHTLPAPSCSEFNS